MLRRSVLTIALVLAAGTAAFAQLPPQPPPPALAIPMTAGNDQERAACEPDVQKYCHDAVPDTFRVLGCLQSNRPKISPACRNVLSSHGQ